MFRLVPFLLILALGASAEPWPSSDRRATTLCWGFDEAEPDMDVGHFFSANLANASAAWNADTQRVTPLGGTARVVAFRTVYDSTTVGTNDNLVICAAHITDSSRTCLTGPGLTLTKGTLVADYMADDTPESVDFTLTDGGIGVMIVSKADAAPADDSTYSGHVCADILFGN